MYGADNGNAIVHKTFHCCKHLQMRSKDLQCCESTVQFVDVDMLTNLSKNVIRSVISYLADTTPAASSTLSLQLKEASKVL